jgi:hypothetical protein
MVLFKLAGWSVFRSISEQFQSFQRLEGLGPVVGLSSAGAYRLGLPDFRTGSAGQSIIDAGLVVGVLLDPLSSARAYRPWLGGWSEQRRGLLISAWRFVLPDFR